LIFRVHVEDANRRPSDGRLADNIDAAPLKVIVPTLVSRMKQLGDPTSFGIDPREVWAFVKITVNASQSQVVEIVAAAMNPRDDMLDVKCGQRRIFLSQLAILAPISGALPHLSSERRAHPLRFGPSHLPRFPLKDGDEFVRPDVTFVLGPFLLGELTFGRFGGQIIDPSLKLRVRPIIQDGFGFVRQNDSQNRANPAVERSAFWCRYHSRTIPNTIHFRKRKKKGFSEPFTRRDQTAAAFLFIAHWPAHLPEPDTPIKHDERTLRNFDSTRHCSSTSL